MSFRCYEKKDEEWDIWHLQQATTVLNETRHREIVLNLNSTKKIKTFRNLFFVIKIVCVCVCWYFRIVFCLGQIQVCLFYYKIIFIEFLNNKCCHKFPLSGLLSFVYIDHVPFVLIFSLISTTALWCSVFSLD